jgi:hypothetical protein
MTKNKEMSLWWCKKVYYHSKIAKNLLKKNTSNIDRDLWELQSNLSYVTFQGNIEIGAHKTGGR